MNIDTQYFGTISYNKEELIHFPEGLFGFPDQKDYLPLAFNKDSDALLCLQSVNDANISFILMNPFLLYEGYLPTLSDDDKKFIICTHKDDMVSYYVICVIHESMEESTVNLKCPIVVNTETRLARQVILENPIYKFRHPVGDFSKKED